MTAAAQLSLAQRYAPQRCTLKLDDEIIELLIATGFAEVWLAKEGHAGKIFINFLNKIELPLIYVLYGAMLAGVDGVIVGAGNPEGLPALVQATGAAPQRSATRFRCSIAKPARNS